MYYNVNYTLQAQSGAVRGYERQFYDEDMARSEVTFAKGSMLTTGEKIISVTMKKMK